MSEITFDNKMSLFLMFGGTSYEVMKFYESVFGAEILSIKYYQVSNGNDLDTVLNGVLRLFDNDILFMDMLPEYFEAHTNSCSLLIKCTTKDEFYNIFDQLKVEGKVIMGPEAVMNLELCTWVTDKYGFTWQLVL